MTRARTLLILVALILLLGGTWYSLLPKRPGGETMITIQLPGTQGGFWIDPFGPNIFHSWWNGRRYYGPVSNPVWHWVHPHAREQALRELREQGYVLSPPPK